MENIAGEQDLFTSNLFQTHLCNLFRNSNPNNSLRFSARGLRLGHFVTFSTLLSVLCHLGSTLTFQLTSPVGSDNLDVTSQFFLLAKRWWWRNYQTNSFFYTPCAKHGFISVNSPREVGFPWLLKFPLWRQRSCTCTFFSGSFLFRTIVLVFFFCYRQ